MTGFKDVLDNKTMKTIEDETIKILSEYCNKDSIVLDIGCYDDYIVDKIDFKKLDLIDLSFGECKHKKDRRIRYYEEDIEKFLTSTFRYYDVIFMSDVIEHLGVKKRVSILANIKSRLKNGGVFIMSYPNAKSLNRILGVEMKIIENPYALGEGDEYVGHKIMYDYDSLYFFGLVLKLEPIRREGIMFKPLPNSMMDEYFKDDLDKFLLVGKKLGAKYCGEIVGVFQK